MDRVYLDWAATALPDYQIQRAALEKSFTYYGNPSSVHSEGKSARDILEEIRKEIALLMAWPVDGVFFTGGGTESNNILITSLMNQQGRNKAACSAIEHPSVLSPVRDNRAFEHTVIYPDTRGIIDAEEVEKALKGVKLLSVMTVNNETGVVQDIEAIYRILPRTVHFHSDAVQAVGKVPLKTGCLDSISLSGHKIGAPKGCGLLLTKKEIPALYKGGGQERGIRPGTESLFSACSLLEALKLQLSHFDEHYAHAVHLKRLLADNLAEMDEVKILPGGDVMQAEKFSPYIIKLSIPPMPGEVIVRIFNDNGIAISTGSACSNKKRDRNEVLKAMGVDGETAASSIRVSWGYSTREEEIKKFIAVLKEQVIPAVRQLR